MRWAMFRALALLVVLLTIVPVLCLRWLAPPVSSFMLHHRWSRSSDNMLHYRWVDWEKISPEVFLSVVAAEDQSFPTHRGFDFKSMRKAWQEYRSGIRTRGASGITQQVAKNLFLWPKKSLVRKGLEAYFTILLEALWPKRRIIEVYVNIAEFGPGVFGVGAASEIYFSKSPDRLTMEEAALLAAVLPNPRRLHIDRPSGYVCGRVAWIIHQMQQLGGAAYIRDL